MVLIWCTGTVAPPQSARDHKVRARLTTTSTSTRRIPTTMANIEAALAAINALGPDEPFSYTDIAKNIVLFDLRLPEDTKAYTPHAR